MGTWDVGVLDNDAAADGLGELSDSVLDDVFRFGAEAPSETTTAKVCAAVGVLLQLSGYAFGADATAHRIVGAVTAHREGMAALAPAARVVMDQVIAGLGENVADVPMDQPEAEVALLNRGVSRSPFGQRHDALFASDAAKAYVQEVADRIVAAVDEGLEDEEAWSDICREVAAMGMLAALMVLAPCKVPVATIDRWRSYAKQGLATLRENEDDELEFHEPYHANLDRTFEVLRRRFA